MTTTAAAAAPPLLATKLYRPRPQARLVVRPRLRALLDAAPFRPLTLVVAPAGFGKTTLLADWLTTIAGRPEARAAEAEQNTPDPEPAMPKAHVAWLSLDAGDNDPGTFLRYLIAAFQRSLPGIGETALLALQIQQEVLVRPLLVSLINDLAARAEDVILVLDDYHLISNPAVQQALEFLLEHQPPCLHIVLSSREEPSLPLARLRVRGRLSEVRATDLRFTRAEAAAFLHDVMGLEVSDADAQAIEQRTEGWVASLQLAALALRRRSDQAALIQAFAASNRYIVDYLVEEVIERMPQHLRTFVLHTAILERMCGPLCDALLELSPNARPVAGDSYTQVILAQLEQANLFVVPLDDERRWYRYHHLFAEVLRERLTRGASAESIATLHRRASQWFVAQGLEKEAVQHALAAQDWALAASMLERFAFRIGLGGETATVLGWLDAMPEEVLRARPFLCILAFIMDVIEQRAGAEAWLEAAERAPREQLPPPVIRRLEGNLMLSRTYLAVKRGDRVRVTELARQLQELLPELDDLSHDSTLTYLAGSYLVSGDVTPASEQQIAAYVAAFRSRSYVVTRVVGILHLARLHQFQGRLHTALATLHRVVELVEPKVLANIVYGAYYHVGQSELLYEWNRLEEVQAQLAQLIAPSKNTVRVEAEYTLRTHVVLARLQFAQGNSRDALATLASFIALAEQRAFLPLIAAHAQALRARLQLALGDLAGAESWASASGLLPDDAELPFAREAEYLTLARVLLAQGQAANRPVPLQQAYRLLTRLLDEAEAKARGDSLLKLSLVRALVLQAQGNSPAALEDLERALRLGAPEGYTRSFLDEGPALRSLLEQARQTALAPALLAYVGELLAAFGPALAESLAPARRPSSALPDELTLREREVLRLLATGLTNKEIADRLLMSVHTVNSHLKAIYGKLGVTTRAAATRAALGSGLADGPAPER
jgi:LuxR family transcriptional regulator, maltose regulon positive regulatory protein